LYSIIESKTFFLIQFLPYIYPTNFKFLNINYRIKYTLSFIKFIIIYNHFSLKIF